MQIDPVRADTWARLAFVLHVRALRDRALEAWHQCLDAATRTGIDRLDKAIDELWDSAAGSPQQRADAIGPLRKVVRVLELLRDAVATGTWIGRLRIELFRSKQNLLWWHAGQFAFALGTIYDEKGDFLRASRFFTLAFNYLRDRYPGEARYRSVRAIRVWALVQDWEANKQGDGLPRILEDAESARRLDALDVKSCAALGATHYYLQDIDKAENAWQDARLWGPNDFRQHYNLGILYAKRASHRRDYTLRQQALKMSVDSLQRAVTLCPLADRGEMHYCLGRTYLLINDLESGISHLRIATALQYQPVVTRLHLGEALRKNRDINAGWAELTGLAMEIIGVHRAQLRELAQDPGATRRRSAILSMAAN